MLGIKTIKHTVLALSLIMAVFAVGVSPTVSADGKGSSDACKGTTGGVLSSQEGTSDEVTVDAGAGNIVTGVCIKSGDEAFGDKHSEVLGNGTYEDGCYKVEGVGTQTVTVSRISEGRDCHGISHIDVVVGQQPDQPDDEDDEEEPTPREEDKDEGNGQVLGASTQVTQPPVGGVGAGAGSTGIAALSIVGLVGSLGALGYGIVRLRKNQ